MFILNITKNKLIASVCGVGALVLILFFCLSGTFSATDQTVDPFAIEDSDCARRAFIESYGIALSPNPPAVEKADIPEEFDESYKDYEMLHFTIITRMRRLTAWRCRMRARVMS